MPHAATDSADTANTLRRVGIDALFDTDAQDDVLGGECSNAQFVEWLREQSKEFTAEGWITETGVWWYVDEHLKHGLVAACVLADDPENENDGEAQADKRGWLRISDYGHRTARKCLTQRQIDTLWDYCEAMGYDYNRNFESIQYLSRTAKVTNSVLNEPSSLKS